MISRRSILTLSLATTACTHAHMNPAEPLPKIIKMAEDRPPRLLSNFSAVFEWNAGRHDPPQAWFRIKCAACQRDAFTATEIFVSLAARDDYPAEPLPVGLSLQCASCRHAAPLFHRARDGYDGELGNSNWLVSEVSMMRPLGDHENDLAAARVRVGFTYNIDLEELEELASPVGRNPPDLFDWFNVEADQGKGWLDVWDAECA